MATTSGIGSIFQSATTSQQNLDKTNSIFTKNSDMYLKLFLAQLKNQDPTQPFDTAQMTEQLSQLNSSQQLIAVNDNLERLISQSNNSQASSLASFINKEVEYLGDTFYQTEGENREFSYLVDKDYKALNIEIRDENNGLIVKYPAELAHGNHKFSWDGKNTLGDPVAAGTYKIGGVAENASGEFTPISTFIRATVTGIDFSSSAEPIVIVGNSDNKIGVDLSRISSVMEKQTTTTTAN